MRLSVKSVEAELFPKKNKPKNKSKNAQERPSVSTSRSKRRSGHSVKSDEAKLFPKNSPAWRFDPEYVRSTQVPSRRLNFINDVMDIDDHEELARQSSEIEAFETEIENLKETNM